MQSGFEMLTGQRNINAFSVVLEIHEPIYDRYMLIDS